MPLPSGVTGQSAPGSEGVWEEGWEFCPEFWLSKPKLACHEGVPVNCVKRIIKTIN